MSDLPPRPPPPDPPSGGPPPSPPPPPPPYGAEGYTVGAAFNWAWTKFQENLGVILIGILIYAAGVIVITLAWSMFVGAVFGISGALGQADPGAGLAAGLFGMMFSIAMTGLVAIVASFVVQAAVTRAALAIAHGRPVEFSLLFETEGLAHVGLGAILLGVGTAIGYSLCFFPGLIVVFFGQFFVLFVLDKKLTALDAILASFSFVNRNLGSLVGFYLASVVAMVLGMMACGVGTLVAFPIVVLAQAYTYRRLQGEPVAA